MDESLNGFYTVYQTCFKDIYDKELASDDGLNLNLAPPFGSSSTVDSDVLAFYSFWTNFVTVLSFAWVDKHNPNDATSRDVSIISGMLYNSDKQTYTLNMTLMRSVYTPPLVHLTYI